MITNTIMCIKIYNKVTKCAYLDKDSLEVLDLFNPIGRLICTCFNHFPNA